jgi:transposase
MSTPLPPDALWTLIEPSLPVVPPNPRGGRLRIPDRACLTGILFVLKTGVPWEYLPIEMGCGSGMTCWRLLRDWQEAGVWDRLHRALLDDLGVARQTDWERACVDRASIPAKGGRCHRTESHGSGQTGHETAPDRRSAGHSLDLSPDRGEPA